MLKSICLNVYGLSTLVINHEDLYNSHFLNRSPQEFGIEACNKSLFIDYASSRKRIIMDILEVEIALFSKQEQLNKCSDEEIKVKLQTMINELLNKKAYYENKYNNLAIDMRFGAIIKPHKEDLKEEKLREVINRYFNHFYSATTVKDKRKIRKLIGKYIDKQIEFESKYTYGCCYTMKEVLEVIRNSFAHVGRIYVGKERGLDTVCILNDFDSSYEKTGEVICLYENLLELLRNPYQLEDEEELKL